MYTSIISPKDLCLFLWYDLTMKTRLPVSALPGNVLKSYGNGADNGKFCTAIIICIILRQVLIPSSLVVARVSALRI